jgi:membrane protein YqaA with SNARE-associated domain
MNFNATSTFEYNLKEKKRFTYKLFAVLGLIILFIILYIFFLRYSDFFLFSGLKNFINHIVNNISSRTFLGIFYAAVFGGLFFVTIPLEAIFVNFLRGGYHPAIIVGIYISGLIVSYTINYLIGFKLNALSKKLISPSKFYKIKAILNRYGVAAIFVFNVLPLPSQPLSTILGVFKYNKTKFYIFFILGQVIKYAVISVAFIYLF